jgi:hypothetical protein
LQAAEHQIPFFTKLHRNEEHVPLHPHLIIFKMLLGAGSISVMIGTKTLSLTVQPQSKDDIFLDDPIQVFT